MLKLRLLTASILLPLFVFLLLYCSNTVFLWVTMAIVILAVIEWIKLLKPKTTINYFMLIAISLLLIGYLLFNHKIFLNLNFIVSVSKITGVFWGLVFIEILLYQLKHGLLFNIYKQQNNKTRFTQIIFGYLFGMLAIIPAWIISNYLKFKNPYLLLLAGGLIIAADSGAYAVGKCWGKHKLSKISPKKTWEGLLGGYIAALLVASIYVIIAKNNFSNLQIIMLTTATVVFAVIGDLFESLLKRIAKVKDSSNILPGHGGILDRIDSFCAGIPIFMLILGTQIW